MRAFIVPAAVVIGLLAQPTVAGPITTPLSLTQNTVKASFSSSPQADAFLITNAIPLVTLHGNMLIELNGFNNVLTIVFSQPLSSLDLDFGLDSSVPANLIDTAMTGGPGGTVLFTDAATATVPAGGFFDEGHLSIGPGAPFDTLVLSSTDADALAIDNLRVVTVAGLPAVFTFDAPEPLSLALFGAGLLASGATRRRRRAA